MGLISQKDQAYLIKRNTKYEPSRPCVTCGLPTGLASVKCLQCLEAAYLAEELAYTRQWLLDHPDHPLELGHDKQQYLHLVLLRGSVRDVGWCGARVTQQRAKRSTINLKSGVVLPSKLSPPGSKAPAKVFCGLCRAACQEMAL